MEPSDCNKTPNKLLNIELTTRKTPISTPKNFATRFFLLSNNNTLTPSPSVQRKRAVRNPFEHQLHERLHLPVISSPSLFHVPSTPKNNSGKLELFEWTIEEISNLNPANLVPNEDQFREEEIDPVKEAQVQAALSSFFNEQIIVPSPLSNSTANLTRSALRKLGLNFANSTALTETAAGGDCGRSHSISLSINANSNRRDLGKQSEFQKRDMLTQTDLSFPPNLPKEVEDCFKKFTQNFDDDCNNVKRSDEEREEDAETSFNGDRSMMDISTLRRKLFINHVEESSERESLNYEDFGRDLNNLSPAPCSPEFELSRQKRNSFETSVDEHSIKANNTLADQIFGEMSPIANLSHSSPIMSSSMQDISMSSDFAGRDYTPIASRHRSNKLKKKRLSDSFSMLHNEEESLSDKENNFECQFQQASTKCTNKQNQAIFPRYDSGFREENSNQMNYSSEFMQI